ncbi:hypothetical protein GO730_38410 [Spirosoma sp. HMF3257]|uniref:Uncharacterized protein n=1 Tax=Spirosoma telluris TaxID=2183553 RepID=A0A327NGA9_9BACT|nr:hypothetical protein [Spirosoma telluris]RAI72986.1 hypothetical protein HMF3257_38325 [Spirosoma telluris]
MEALSDEQLKKVVEELETGMNCYLHRQIGEVIAFPDPDQFPDTDDWQQEMDEIETRPDDYLEITSMSSRESFQIMERFISEVDSPAFRNRLLYALDQPKPFRRFKQLIDESSEYRQGWFAFRESQTIEWLREQLALED